MSGEDQPAAPALPRSLTVTLYLCFFLSGVAGLIYEVLWARYLALYVGSTGLAQVIVLATFMGGLALGSHVLGRAADRVASPLKLYVLLEFGIGVYALFFERVFFGGRALFLALVGALGMNAGSLVLGKVIACILSMLLPTFLMGGTLPVLGRYMIRSMTGVGPKVSRLYFLNSLGAVCGCLLSGFYLIRTFGLQFSMISGAGLNIVVGLAAMLVLARAGSPASQDESPAREEGGPGMPRWVYVVVLACVGLSGAVSMLYEVAWIRLLTLVLGSSTYSFSLMLATFILGLSVGGLLLSLRTRVGGYTMIFGMSEVAVGITVLLTLPFYVRLPLVFNHVASSLQRDPSTFGLYQAAKFILCALVMFLPAVFQGITLPAATKVLTKDVGGLGRQVGHVFAVNTIGTLLGVIYAGFLGLPDLGMKGTLELAVALNIILGLVVLSTLRQRGRRHRLLLSAGGAAVLVGGWYMLAMGAWDKDLLGAGLYRTRERIPTFEVMLQQTHERETVFYRDGVDATVAVQDMDYPAPERLLVINGKVDASTIGDLPTQKMIGHLPLLLHHAPKNVLIVGLGSGTTLGSVLAHDVERVDVVELSREVIQASRYFAEVNGRYWEDPRATVYWEDAKTFLQVTDRKYDVIISEPTNPWIAGVAGVFSHEYFETCRQHLESDGLLVQWLQSYEMEDPTFYLTLETFTASYPYYTLWNPTRADTVLVGSDQPYQPDLDAMEVKLSDQRVRADLQPLGIRSLLPILAMQMADHASVFSHIRWLGTFHSDFFPILDYVAPRGFYVGSLAQGAKLLDDRPRAPANADLWVTEYLQRRKLPAEDFQDTYVYVNTHRGLFNNLSLAWAGAWTRQVPGDARARVAFNTERPASFARVREETQLQLPDAGFHARYETKLRCRRAYEDYVARRSFLDSTGAEAALGDLAWFIEHYPDANDPAIYRWYGELLYDLGRYTEAAEALIRAQKLLILQPRIDESELIDTAILTCRALLARGDRDGAAAIYHAVLKDYSNELKVFLVEAQIRDRVLPGE